MDEQVPLAAAVGTALLLLAAGAAVSVSTRRAADGRLARNSVAGIRTGATMRSDEAWRAGHEAARGVADASGAVFALTGLCALATRDAERFAAVAGRTAAHPRASGPAGILRARAP
jgi:hypothetical protein